VTEARGEESPTIQVDDLLPVEADNLDHRGVLGLRDGLGLDLGLQGTFLEAGEESQEGFGGELLTLELELIEVFTTGVEDPSLRQVTSNTKVLTESALELGRIGEGLSVARGERKSDSALQVT